MTLGVPAAGVVVMTETSFRCGPAESPTPTQHYYPLGGPGANAVGDLYYAPAGVPTLEFQPGGGSGLGFPIYTGPSGPDYAGDCVNSAIYIVLVGSGTLTIDTVAHSGTMRVAAQVIHYSPGGASVDQTVIVDQGQDIVLDIPDDLSERCRHVVRISDGGGACGGKWGFGGADWVSNDLCRQYQATPGVYQSLHSVGAYLSGPFVIPADANEDWCLRADLNDSFGFDGYPAGGTGGARTIALRREDTGALFDWLYWGSGGFSDPSGHGPISRSVVVPAATVAGSLAGHAWRWYYVNLDNRESWEADIAHVSAAPSSNGCEPCSGTVSAATVVTGTATIDLD